MTEKVNGITVFTVNYKDSDKILTLFTLEKGKITANAKGVRKANAKCKPVSEPFCFAEIMLAEKSGRYTVTEVNSFDSFYPIRLDLRKYYAGMTALEFTDAFMQDGMEDPDHFVLLAEFLKDLSYGDGDAKDKLAEFLYSAVNQSGYSMALSVCGRCGKEIKDRVFLSVKDGYCVCDECRKTGEGEFSYDTYKYLKALCDGLALSHDEDCANNALKFFGYYVSKVSGVNLKCLTTLIEL